MADLRDVELALVDLDGTVYIGTRPVSGAVAALAKLRDIGLAVRFVTNTDSITPGALLDRLAGLGVEATEAEVLTPVALARQLLDGLQSPRLLAVASPGIRELLGGFLATRGERVTHVLVCDPSYGVTYDDLDAAFRAVRAGAELLATQVARIVRRDDGEHLDTGGFVRLLEYATGERARVLGKPSPDFFRLALETAGIVPERAVMVGDDLAADVAGAQRVGMRGVLVHTGKGAERHPDAGTAPRTPPSRAWQLSPICSDRERKGPPMQSPDDLARRLADETRPVLGAEGFSDERIDELASAFIADRIGHGEAQFVNWARAEGPFGIDPEEGF